MPAVANGKVQGDFTAALTTEIPDDIHNQTPRRTTRPFRFGKSGGDGGNDVISGKPAGPLGSRDRNVELSVPDVFPCQRAAGFPGNELVILRFAQRAYHGEESIEEAGDILELVSPLQVLEGGRGARRVPQQNLSPGARSNRSFQMKVQLGLRHPPEDGPRHRAASGRWRGVVEYHVQERGLNGNDVSSRNDSRTTPGGGIMTPARRVGPSSRRMTVPWGSLALAAISGGVLLAQATGLLATPPLGWVLAPDRVEFPAVLTYAFFHADALHWLVNMALLLAVAPRLERTLGTTAVLLVFVLGAIVAGLVHVSVVVLFAHDAGARPLLGSSGGVMALLGAYAVRYYGRRISPLPGRRKRGDEGRAFSVPLGWALFAWLLTEAAFGWRGISAGGGPVAHWAHVGGFLAGMSLAVLAGWHAAGRREEAAAQASLDVRAERLAEYVRDHPGDAASRVTYAQALLQLGERDRAAAAWSRAVETWLHAGRRREAAETWLALRAAQLQPPGHEIALQAARALEETGYREDALAVYDGLAATYGPESEGAALRAAQLAERLGHPEDARQRFQMFLLMHPDSQFVGQARRGLDRLPPRV